jgi:hypothetical protein
MSSNGLVNRAKMGRCRICQRVRSTNNHVKSVGEVCHGYATGHIWECIDVEECDKIAKHRLSENHMRKNEIEIALKRGRYSLYVYIV